MVVVPGILHNLLDRGPVGFETEKVSGISGIGEKLGRIAGASRIGCIGYRPAHDPTHSIEDFQYGNAVAGAQIAGEAFLAPQQAIQRSEVTTGQVADMDEVAHTAPVGRIVICTEQF